MSVILLVDDQDALRKVFMNPEQYSYPNIMHLFIPEQVYEETSDNKERAEPDQPERN